MAKNAADSATPGDSAPEPGTPAVGGGWPVIDGWAKASLSLQGPLLWRTLLHKSACLSCAWGTGGQNGGFNDELGEPLQRCLKNVEAISAELQAAVPKGLFGQRSIEPAAATQLPGGRSAGAIEPAADPAAGPQHYEPIGWDDVFDLTEAAFKVPPQRLAS